MNVNDITKIINVIRRTTTVVKLIPFVFAAIYLIDFAALPLIDDTEPPLTYLLVYQSPLNIFFLIILSYCLKLCVWHRLECLLPLLPLVSVFIDEHICDLSQIAVYVNYGMVAAVFAASLVNAYFIFVKPNRIKRK